MRKSILQTIILFFLWPLNAANVVPTAGAKYYILQTATKSGKVVGASGFNESVITTAENSLAQQFEFIPVAGKTDTYYIKSATGQFLVNSIDVLSLTEYSTDAGGSNTEWVLTGSALSSIRLKANSSGYLGTTALTDGSYLYCDKTATDANGTFKLVPVSTVVVNNLIDPGFEGGVVDGAPLGTWINNADKTLGNDDAATQNFRSRIINNGYQSVDNNAFLLRYYGDANSYTKISHKLTGLTQGATYSFSYKYKQGNVNSADATVSAYASLLPNDVPTNSIGSVFTSTPPTSTAATQTAQTGTVTFVAPGNSCFVVFAKNPSSTNNYLHYIDDMALTKTKDAEKNVQTSVSAFSFSSTNRADTMLVTGSLLTDSIRITAPEGIDVNPKVLPPNAGAVQVIVSSRGFYSLAENLTLTSGDVQKKLPLTATYNTSFVTPVNTDKYIIQQRIGGKVIGKKAGTTQAVLRYAEKDEKSQQFQFVAVNGKSNVFYMLNAENKYLTKSKNTASLLEYTDNILDNASYPRYSEWVLQGVSDTLVYITQASDAAKTISSDSIVDGRTLYNDRSASSANSTFILQNISTLNTGFLFDPGFENAAVDGGPLGTWIPSNDPVQLGAYGYSRVQGGNGWATAGKKCMYLRFLGDATSYNSISQKVFSLVKGATYRLDLQYKVQSTSSTALVNIYAATTANAATSAAIGGLYTTTTAASSNTATQTAQSASLTFVAPASSVYIVYAKNTSSTNFNFFIDNLSLTETKPSAVESIYSQPLLKVYVGDELYVDYSLHAATATDFKIYSVDSRLVYNKTLMSCQGFNHQALNVGLKSGVYLLRMEANGQVTNTKFVK
jgi:hypothetical protein